MKKVQGAQATTSQSATPSYNDRTSISPKERSISSYSGSLSSVKPAVKPPQEPRDAQA